MALSRAHASEVYPRNTLSVRIRSFAITSAVAGMPIEGSFEAIHKGSKPLSGTIYLGILDDEFAFEGCELVTVEVPASSPGLVRFKNGPIPQTAGRKWLEFRSENSDRVSFHVRRS
jgi:hypothetical protein